MTFLLYTLGELNGEFQLSTAVAVRVPVPDPGSK